MHKRRNEAIIAREMFYDTGKPCKRGHLEPRYASSGICKECQRETNLLQASAMRGEQVLRAQKRAKQQAVLDDCGPHSREEAVSVDLDWYATTLPSCHGVLKLDGVTCHLCGLEVAAAKALLIERMLS